MFGATTGPVAANRPLKVLVWHWGRTGGGSRYTYDLAAALAERDDVTVGLSISAYSEIYSLYGDHEWCARHDVRTYRSIRGFATSPFRLPWVRLRFARFLRRERFDVVLCTMDHLWNPFVAGAVRGSGARYVQVVHDAVRHLGDGGAMRQRLLRRGIKVTDGVIVLSDAVRRQILEVHGYPRERVFSSKHGAFGYAERSAPRELPSARAPRLLFFGRIAAYKGLGVLLEAMPRIRSAVSGTELHVFGDGDLTPYRSLLDKTEGVHVHNRWIPEGEIARIFEDADLAVFPYLDGSQSGVVTIALAAGVPCVITPTAGLVEQVPDRVAGVTAASTRPADLAEAVIEPLDDPSLYRTLSTGALNEARRELDWHVLADGVVRSLRTVASKLPRR